MCRVLLDMEMDLSASPFAPVRIHVPHEAGEHIARAVLAHEDILVPVPRDDLERMPSRRERLEPLIADDVRVGEDVVALSSDEQDRRVDLLGEVEVIVGQMVEPRVGGVVLHGAAGAHHLPHVPVVVDAGGAVEISAALVGDVVQVLVVVDRGPAGAPHHAEHVAGRHVALGVEQLHGLSEQPAPGEQGLVASVRVNGGRVQAASAPDCSRVLGWMGRRERSRSAKRSERAAMVSAGLGPTGPGITEPSAT